MRTVRFHHPELDKFVDAGSWRRLWIVTGGQSGVDRAALEVALQLHLPVRGWCPADRAAEDGAIDPGYPLQNTSSTDPAMRTELNSFDSDGTLVISAWAPRDGTSLTLEVTKLHSKPVFEVDLAETAVSDNVVSTFRRWIESNNIRILNVAGPRESLRPGMVANNAKIILTTLFTWGCSHDNVPSSLNVGIS